MSNSKYFFAYDASLDPTRLLEVAPDAEFLFAAHLPETRLDFVSGPTGALPTLSRDPGHTVWGALFAIGSDRAPQVEQHLGAGRRISREHKAVDREGNKHECYTFIADGESTRPDADYVDIMIAGARHWGLPAGWILGLEDLPEDPLFG